MTWNGRNEMGRVLAPFVVSLVVLIALSAASACSPPPRPGPVALDASDAGHEVRLGSGQTLDISLASNPTTGYRWDVEALDGDVLKQVGEADYEPQSKLAGAPGVEILHFEAVGSGRTSLRLIYHRSWEKDVEPLETFSVEVVVQ